MSKPHAALTGVATAAVAVAAGELIAGIWLPEASPVGVVGSAVIDAAPPWGKEFATSTFGVHDKVALEIGTLVLLTGFAVLVGLLGRRNRQAGLAGVGLFGVIGVVAALTRASATGAWALPSIVAALAGAATYWWLLGRVETAVRPDDRRRFIRTSWWVIVGAAVAGYAGRLLGQRERVQAARQAIVLPTPSGQPAADVPGAQADGLPYVIPNDDFYRIDIAFPEPPQLDPSTWSLHIFGQVGKELTLTWDDLLKRPMIERYVTLSCVSNEVGGDLIGNAKWLGVPLADLLDEVQPDPAADQVVSYGPDGFTAGTPTAVLRDGRDAMIAVAMNGEPLPVEHGFPARLVVPGLYGYVSATKWVTKIEVTTFDAYDAYWVPRGWAKLGPIKTESRIDRPRRGSTLPVGPVTVAGVAWAVHRGISKVEVRVDDGPWQEATLADVASVDTWRLWSWQWSATAGDHTLAVRATDNTGTPQTDEQRPPAPDGASGYHTITVGVS